jgi:hypothetical protein
LLRPNPFAISFFLTFFFFFVDSFYLLIHCCIMSLIILRIDRSKSRAQLRYFTPFFFFLFIYIFMTIPSFFPPLAFLRFLISRIYRERRATRQLDGLEANRISKRFESVPKLEPEHFTDETKYLRHRVTVLETDLLHEKKISDLVNSKSIFFSSPPCPSFYPFYPLSCHFFLH